MRQRGERILMTGNEAMAEAALGAGCQFYAGYPITPQNELTALMASRMTQEQRVFIQAESEIAAINMVFGAAATGARAMTSSSSPGISLKQEGISYMAGAQLPCVIINVMRGGPGLGNIASAQGDYFQSTRGGGHGDYFTPAFSPWSVQEALALVGLCFDVADYYRTPVLLVADALIAQMMEAVSVPAPRLFKKKLAPKDWVLSGAAQRTPRVAKSFFLKEGDLEIHNQRLQKKWQTITRNEQRYDKHKTSDADILLVAYGSQARIAAEALQLLRGGGVRVGLFRPISLWPYPARALQAVGKKIKKVFVIEQSLGQMVDDVRLSLPGKEVIFLGRAGGGIPGAHEIATFVKKNI